MTLDEEPNQATCWPHGSYGLLKADSGCPAGDWDEGWSIISSTSNKLTLPQGQSKTHLYGWVTEKDKDIAMYFCVKSLSESPEQDRQSDCNIRSSSSSWPNGNYCILKTNNNCPEGFNSHTYGDVLVWSHIENKGGCTPPINRYVFTYYSRNRRSYFRSMYAYYVLCCRSDGDLTEPVSLPNHHSFILLANTRASSNIEMRPCQEVKGMQVHPEIIRSNYTVTAYNVFYFGKLIQLNLEEDFILCYYSPLGEYLCLYSLCLLFYCMGRVSLEMAYG